MTIVRKVNHKITHPPLSPAKIQRHNNGLNSLPEIKFGVHDVT